MTVVAWPALSLLSFCRGLSDDRASEGHRKRAITQFPSVFCPKRWGRWGGAIKACRKEFELKKKFTKGPDKC